MVSTSISYQAAVIKKRANVSALRRHHRSPVLRDILAAATEGASITGGPTTGFDTSRNLWVVVNKGTMTRSPAVAHVHIPDTSQFYEKAVAHENQHVANYNPGGVFGDLYIVNDLFSRLAALTDSTKQGLSNKIAQAVGNWDAEQRTIFNSRRRADEQAAYAASDPVGPQYLGMWQCQQSRYP